MCNIIKYSIYFLTTFVILSCSVPIKGSGPYDLTELPSSPGQRYYVGTDIFLITANITTTTKSKVNNSLAIETSNLISTNAVIDKKLLPDYKQYFMLQLDKSGAYDDKTTITTTSNGLLTGLTADSTGKTGDVIKSIAAIGANIIAGKTVRNLTPSPKVQLFESQNINNLVNPCFEVASFFGLSNEHKLFSKSNTTACELLLEKKILKSSYKTLFVNINQLRVAATKATTESDLKKISSDLVRKNLILTNTKKELELINTNYNLQFGVFKSSKLATKVVTQKLIESFELNDLPDDTVLQPLLSLPKSQVISNLNAIKKYKKISDFFNKTNILITATPLIPATQTLPATPLIPVNSPPNEDGCDKLEDECDESESTPTNRIYFRQTHPVTIGQYRFFQNIGKPNVTYLQSVSKNIIDIMSPKSTIQSVEYKPSLFSGRKLTLSFDPITNSLTKIETDNKSSLSAATGSISEAFTNYQTTYQAALDSASKANKTLNAIELEQYSKQVTELTTKKEIIDAQVAFEGAEATQDILIEKKIIDSKLSALKSDLALKKAESTYEQKLFQEQVKSEFDAITQQLALETTKISYEQKLELEKLKAELFILTEKLKILEKKEAIIKH